MLTARVIAVNISNNPSLRGALRRSNPEMTVFRRVQVKIRMWLCLGISFLICIACFNFAYAAQHPAYSAEIARKVAECEAKFHSVHKKEHLFVDCMQNHQLKKKYYLKILKNFQNWLDQSKIILRTLQPEEVQQNVIDFDQNCHDYTKQITEYLDWVQGKTPAEGFSMPNPDLYFKEAIQ